MNKTKRSYIALTMLGRLGATTIIINLILLFVVGNMTKDSLRNKEADYLTEIVSNISNNIATTIHEYVAIAEVVAMNGSIANLLEESTAAQPMHTNDNVMAVIYDLAVLEANFPAILNVAVMDIEQDGYLLHNGGYSDSSFSFKARDYYSVVTTGTSVITEPYLDVESGGLVISAVSPVFSQEGKALGAIVVDLSIEFIADLVRSSDFGETGGSMIIDGAGMIMGHSDSSLVGKSYSNISLSGSDLESELQNPTKTIIGFTMEGESRVGEVGRIGNLDWVLLTSISEREFNTESNNIQLTLLGMLLVSVAVTLVVVAVTVVHSLRPLHYIKEAMNQLSSGNLHYHLDYESNNEIGELADNLRVTMENLASYIDEIQRLLSSCGHGDFTVSSNMEFIGDFEAIQTSINEFIDLISNALGGIKATVEQVSIGSDYVATGSQNLAEGSMKQSVSVQELNVHIRDISEKVTKNVETVKFVNESSQDMSKGLLTGNERMEHLVQSMAEIARTSEGIQKIIKTIEDVAFQTNILALNAAVEAARAGTSGRGFAVVAEEVRNLATRTSIAVNETTQLITETVSAVQSGSEVMDETAEGLNEVIAGLDGFMSSLGEITTASEEQAEAITAIHNDVTAITSVMQTNSAISEESAATSEELSSQASVMKETISQFKTASDQVSHF